MILLAINSLIISFQGLYSVIASYFGYGCGLTLLSIIVSIFLLPIVNWSVGISKKERELQSIITPKIEEYKSKLKGADLSDAISSLYKRYSYNPLLRIRLSLPELIQFPLLILAFFALSNYAEFQEKSFLFIKDLSKTDNLLFGISILPLLMFCINCLTVYISPTTNKEKTTSYFISFVFLVLLYVAPSALVIYCITNSNFNLFLVLTKKFKKSNLGIKSNISNLFKNNQGALVASLSLLVPATYVWSVNITIYEVEPILYSAVILILMSIFVFVCLSFFRNILSKKISIKYYNFVVIIICCLSLYVLGNRVRSAYNEYKYVVAISILLFLLVLYAIAKFKIIKIIFFVILIFNTCVFFFNVQNERNLSIEANSKNDIIIDFSLKNKPNIYYFLLESLHSTRALKQYYNQDISSYNKCLENLGFKIYDEIYSNRNFTLGTLSTVMSFNLDYNSHGIDDANLYVRHLITGGKGNNLMKLLKLNGYRTNLYFRGIPYFGLVKGEYLDYFDTTNEYFSKFIIYMLPIIDLNPKISRILGIEVHGGSEKNSDPWIENAVFNYVEKIDKNVPHAFFSTIDYSTHTDSYRYSYKDKQEWVKSQTYQESVKREFEAIKKIAKNITEKDPNSVIVFLGDHGSARLRGYPIYANSVSKLKEFAKNDGEDLNSVTDDFFSVYAAIKMPKGYDFPDDFSSVNIFLKALAILNPNVAEKLQKYEQPNLSCFTNDLKFYKNDGKLEFIESK